MTRIERQSISIAKALVKVLYRIEQFDDDPELICEDAKIELAAFEKTM